MTSQLPAGSRYLHQLAATPLVPVQLDPAGPRVWCKLEFLNPSGSTKDRIARYILEKAWRQNRLGPGWTVVEASSGSTSIAMALACAQLGIRFIAVMPEGVSNERVLIIRAYGGEVRFTPKEKGIRGSLDETECLAHEPKIFLPRQFSNLDNAEAHRVGTAREILDQIPNNSVDAIVSGVGTGGTLVGLFQGLRECGCPVIPVAARPVQLNDSMEIECCSFSQRIPGVAESISEIFTPERLPGLITIEVQDELALETTCQLIRRGFPLGWGQARASTTPPPSQLRNASATRPPISSPSSPTAWNATSPPSFSAACSSPLSKSLTAETQKRREKTESEGERNGPSKSSDDLLRRLTLFLPFLCASASPRLGFLPPTPPFSLRPCG